MSILVDDCAPNSGAKLKALACFKDLSASECDRVFAALSFRSMRRGTTLMLNREAIGCGGFVWSGVYRIVLASAATRPVGLELLRCGDLFGFFSNPEKWGDALRLECREPGLLLTMKSLSFAALRKEAPALAEVALTTVAKRAEDFGDRIVELATLSARERVVAELLRLSRTGDWRGRSCLLRPAPTHQELAESIGAVREVVTRVLRGLQAEGLVEVARGQCKINDVDRLLALDERSTGRRMFDASTFANGLLSAAAGAAWLLPLFSQAA